MKFRADASTCSHCCIDSRGAIASPRAPAPGAAVSLGAGVMGGGMGVQVGVLRGKRQAEGERLSVLPKCPPM